MEVYISSVLPRDIEKELKDIAGCVEIQGKRGMEYWEQTAVKYWRKGGNK